MALHEHSLEERLKAWAGRYGVCLEYLAEAASTNLSAREKEYPGGALVLAEKQTAGRGQRGNSWSSAPGENLTFSVVLRPDFLPAQQQFYLSKAVCLALADTLEELLSSGTEAGRPSTAGNTPDDTPAPQTQSPQGQTPVPPRVSIKWPNDIYAGDRKIVGMLIEHDLSGERLARSIVGIGLNVNQRVFPEGLPNPTSLALETGLSYDPAQVLERLYAQMGVRYDQLGRGELAGIDRDYLRRIYLLGRESRFANGLSGEPFRGTITGVKPTGELEVEHSLDGRKRYYLFKEIEYLR